MARRNPGGLTTFDEILAWVQEGHDFWARHGADQWAYPDSYPGCPFGTSSAWISPEGEVFPLRGAVHADFVARFFNLNYGSLIGHTRKIMENREAAYDLMLEAGWIPLRNAWEVSNIRVNRDDVPLGFCLPAGQAYLKVVMAVILVGHMKPEEVIRVHASPKSTSAFTQHKFAAAELIDTWIVPAEAERFWGKLLRSNPFRRRLK